MQMVANYSVHHAIQLNVVRKNSIDCHLESELHMKRTVASRAEGQSKRQMTTALMFKRATETSAKAVHLR